MSDKSYLRIVVFAILLIASVLVLKFVPLKPENIYYNEVQVLEPSEKKSIWFSVKKGHRVSISYSVDYANPIEISILSPDTSFMLGSPLGGYSYYHDEGTFGSGYFQAEEEGKYILYIVNPAEAGFFGYGTGPTIMVTINIETSGYTTWM